VLFDEECYAKLYKEVPKFKLITPSIISDRLKVRAPRRGARQASRCHAERGP